MSIHKIFVVQCDTCHIQHAVADAKSAVDAARRVAIATDDTGILHFAHLREKGFSKQTPAELKHQCQACFAQSRTTT